MLRHRSYRGYGAALKTGIAAAAHDCTVITDADGTDPSRYIPALLEHLEHNDMVVGARIGTNVSIPVIRKPPKWVPNKLANYVTNHHIPDLNSGLRAFRRDVATQYFPILSDQFSFTTTITLGGLWPRCTAAEAGHRDHARFSRQCLGRTFSAAGRHQPLQPDTQRGHRRKAPPSPEVLAGVVTGTLPDARPHANALPDGRAGAGPGGARANPAGVGRSPAPQSRAAAVQVPSPQAARVEGEARLDGPEGLVLARLARLGARP